MALLGISISQNILLESIYSILAVLYSTQYRTVGRYDDGDGEGESSILLLLLIPSWALAIVYRLPTDWP